LARLVGAAAAIAIGVAVAPPAVVQAGQVAGAITSLDLVKTNGDTVLTNDTDPYDFARVDIDWAVPNGTQPGDFFTVTLPENLCCGPTAFTLKDPSGVVIANAAVTSGGEGGSDTITFTFTDAVAGRQNVVGTAFYEARWESANDRYDTTEEVTFSVNGQAFYSETVGFSERPGQVDPPPDPYKYGYFAAGTNECTTDNTECLIWVVKSPAGPLSSVTITDDLGPGQTVNTATCGAVTASKLNRQGGWIGFVEPTSVTCTSTRVTVTMPSLPDGESYIIDFRVSVPVPIDPSRAITYTNGASITAPGGRSWDVASSVRSAGAGGDASGDRISITKRDAAGNDADTAAAAASLPSGSTTLQFTITNSGDTILESVVVTDVSVGSGTVTGLTCTFPGGSTGTTWAGPFVPAASFPCTASLTGVTSELHTDTATVTARGNGPVTASNPYNAVRPETPATTSTTTTTTTSTTIPPDTTVASTTTTAADSGAGTTSTTSTTSTTIAAALPPTPSTTPGLSGAPLPATGSESSGLLVAALVLCMGGSGMVLLRRSY
jgi:LPXTG-motif cell wall-anchored protein